ncbi:putative flippase GtrA [Silvimonas terrae]|uniref:Putative flippase GtrA n=1 Tax=Silvimonas terrae TaxID=300266 RepID=A0A840RHA7_9NEIS|nr:GtrA family protein [Silvimonas terrae]MBB5192457.1 putative flippase GtrA [Silvimonas terrae]
MTRRIKPARFFTLFTSSLNVHRMHLIMFGLTSGIGWLIDFGVFSLLVHLSLRPGFANLISASLAVTFVYFTSVRRIFSTSQTKGVANKFVVYLIYQAMAVPLASIVVDLLVSWHTTPLVAKIAVVPFTCYSNFVFTSYLLTGRARWY